jgi:mono/diheme cytochrome c family protein
MKELLTLAALFAVAPQLSSRSVQEGRTLYTSYGCYECHGREAQGGAAGPRIARYQNALTGFTGYLRHPSGNMPPYSANVLPDKDAADIYAFLKSITPPKPVKDIQLLNQ